MLSMSETGREFASPAQEILVRGIKIKIKDMDKTLKAKDGSQVQSNKFRMTQLEVGVQGEKQLIVPTFGMTSSLFVRQFEILRQLSRRIKLLKQAYNLQSDENRSWEQVDLIIEVLDRGI